jgi:hypothetical protein
MVRPYLSASLFCFTAHGLLQRPATWTTAYGLNLLGINIVLHLLETPINQWINFNQPPLIHLKHLQIPPFSPLTPPPACDNSFNSKFLISPSGGFYLDQIIVRRFIRFP